MTKLQDLIKQELAKPVQKTRTALQLDRITRANQEQFEQRHTITPPTQPISQISFTIPGDFVSVNNTYQTFINKKGQIQRTKTKKATNWKTHVITHTTSYKGILKPSLFYKITLEVYTNWFTKSGSIKKRDVANAEKLITDGVDKGLGLDDSHFFEIVLKKVQTKNEPKIRVTVEVMDSIPQEDV